MIWKLSGRCKKIEGPKLVRLWFSTIRFCTRFTANESQYLRIEFKDGHTENIKGPTSIYKDHLLHSNISVKEAVNVGKHEAIVVYTNEKGKGSVNTLTESIKRGPLVFFPAVNQTLKTFQHCVRGGDVRLDFYLNVYLSCTIMLALVRRILRCWKNCRIQGL